MVRLPSCEWATSSEIWTKTRSSIGSRRRPRNARSRPPRPRPSEAAEAEATQEAAAGPSRSRPRPRAAESAANSRVRRVRFQRRVHRRGTTRKTNSDEATDEGSVVVEATEDDTGAVEVRGDRAVVPRPKRSTTVDQPPPRNSRFRSSWRNRSSTSEHRRSRSRRRGRGRDSAEAKPRRGAKILGRIQLDQEEITKSEETHSRLDRTGAPMGRVRPARRTIQSEAAAPQAAEGRQVASRSRGLRAGLLRRTSRGRGSGNGARSAAVDAVGPVVAGAPGVGGAREGPEEEHPCRQEGHRSWCRSP